MWIDDFYFQFPSKLIPLEFTSYLFVCFCFVVFIFLRFKNTNIRTFILTLANLVFIYTFGSYHLVFVFGVAVFTYLFSFIVDKYPGKYLYFSIYIPFFSLLAYFKYFNIDNLIIPLGLSFYTFKAMSYLFDILNKKNQIEKNPIVLFCYLSFFPTMIAGPINRSKKFFEQLKKPTEFNYLDAKSGAFQMLLGIFEKIVFCDFIASVVNRINGVELFGMNILLMIFLYSLQIYLDFDSLSNIAIGSARLLGFDIGINFKSPYLANNLKNFWRRWHISLSTWFKDYVYIFLGGSRKGSLIKYLNLTIVFIISGVWHGNTLNFLLWGLLHALIQIIEDIVFSLFKDIKVHKVISLIINFFGIIINFIVVSFLWLIFKYQSLEQVISVLEKMFIFQKLDFELIGLTQNEVYWLVCVIIILVIVDILRYHYQVLDKFNSLFFPIRWSFYILMIIVFLIFGVYGGIFNSNDFIYRWF